MLVVRIQCQPAFASEKEASGPLVAVAAVLASASRCGLVWARCRDALLPFDAGTVEPLLSADRFLHADNPRRATHVLSLCATPEGPGEVGVVSVNVRPDAPPAAAPGITLSLSLPEAVFDTETASLRRLLEGCVAAVSADVAVLGPAAWVRDLGVGWATLARQVRREVLPTSAVVVAMGSGWLVIAHAEEPASESAAAREAVCRVREALQGESARTPAVDGPASVAAIPLGGSPPPVLAQPSYLAAPTAVARPPEHLSGTVLSVDVPRGPSLPFARGAGNDVFISSMPEVPRPPEHLSGTALSVDVPLGPSLPFARSARNELPATSAPEVARPREDLTGTTLPVDAPRGPAVPFTSGHGAEAQARGPLTVPAMSVLRYALFRARLTVLGEEDGQTLHEFGVTSPAVKEALQSRFAARFREDPAAQSQFVELLRTLVSELRAQAHQR